jgi:predicted TPR repeat methyltransferase
VDLDHHAAAAEHLLDSLAGKNRETAPPQYVIDVFDNYAERFEHSLIEELDYKVPELLRRMLDEEWDPKKIFPCGLDLGCGTGLSGLAFQSRVEQLTGIDLSEKMLQQAAAKGLYHALHCAELVDFLNSASTQQYDLVIAADVFTYIGNLRPLFKALPGRLRVDAALLFSTEHHANGGDYILRRSGRFSHGVRYIEDLARAHGFTLIRHEETDIRKDRGQWLRGDLYHLAFEGKGKN